MLARGLRPAALRRLAAPAPQRSSLPRAPGCGLARSYGAASGVARPMVGAGGGGSGGGAHSSSSASRGSAAALLLALGAGGWTLLSTSATEESKLSLSDPVTSSGSLILFSGNANTELATEIAVLLGVPLGAITVGGGG